jgi:hypothetical protein
MIKENATLSQRSVNKHIKNWIIIKSAKGFCEGRNPS